MEEKRASYGGKAGELWRKSGRAMEEKRASYGGKAGELWRKSGRANILRRNLTPHCQFIILSRNLPTQYLSYAHARYG
jgi:hypothetical protein